MPNREYEKSLHVVIDCADQEMPMSIAQLGQSVKINLSDANITLGNVAVPQMAEMKSADMLPLTSSPLTELPLLHNGRRINHG